TDITLIFRDISGNVEGKPEGGTSHEAVVVQGENGADLASGTWGLKVCPFLGPSLQPPLPNQTPPFTYIAAAVVSNIAASAPTLPRPLPPTLVTNNPRWAFFPSFPAIDYSTTTQSEG